MPPKPIRRSGSRINQTEAFRPEAGAVPFPGYRLVRLRGVGGFATVWESESPGGERIALKFMSSANASTTAKEVRSLQSVQPLRHPYLLKTRDVWSMPGNIVIAMDLADGTMLDLFELYNNDLQKQIEIEKLCLYLCQTAEALDFLNARRHRVDGRLVGYQHGDVKPNNILLLNDEAKLGDYGLATPTSGPMTPCPRQGTAEYCAPEVFQGMQSERSDQYSLAVTYFVLRTGHFPFPAPPPKTESLRGYVRPEPNLLALDEAERPAMLRALSTAPQNRFPSCAAFMSAILQALKLRLLRAEEDSALIQSVILEPVMTPPQSTFVSSRQTGGR